MDTVTGGEIVARALRAHGVTHLFTLPGVGIFTLYEACAAHGIEIVGFRHEQAAVHAAEGWARVCGRTGVVAVGEGPGHANAMAGLANAWAESSPLLLLSATDETSCLGRGAIQELPQIEMCSAITNRAELVRRPADLPQALRAAFAAARTGMPGPTHLSLPFDVLESLSEPETETPEASAVAATPPPPGFARAAVEMLLAAQRPAVLAGSAAHWSDAGGALRSFVESTGLPVFTIERARGMISDDHPLCFGEGYTTANPASECLRRCDVVLLLGERVDCRLAYGASFGSARLIHVAPDAADLNRNRAAALGAACDAGRAAAALAEEARGRTWPDWSGWRGEIGALRAAAAAQLAPLAADSCEPLHPLRLVAEAARHITPDTVLVFDGGDFSGWARSFLRARRPGGWQIGTVLGAMGTGLPYAIGAAVAAAPSRVLLLTGDGALGFHTAELDTAARLGLPLTILVANDAAWGIEEHFHERWFGAGRRLPTPIGDVRWDGVAAAMGVPGERIETLDALGPALNRAFAAPGPALVDVRTRSVPSPQAETFARVLLRRRARARRGGVPPTVFTSMEKP